MKFPNRRILAITFSVCFLVTLCADAQNPTIRKGQTLKKDIKIDPRLRPVIIKPTIVDSASNQNKPKTPIDDERKGPTNITFNIIDPIQFDLDLSGNEILNIFSTIYRDGNRNTGYYYYLPASYDLSWSDKTGEYDFNVSYGTANEGGRGETTVTAILKPKLTRNEIKFARELLKQNIRGKTEAQYGVKDLMAVPMAQAPEISFTNLSQFDVEEADISIRAPSDLMDPIYISFTTSRIDDLMGMFFNNIGLYGDVIIYPDGDDMPATVRIPFNLKIDDSKTYGQFELSQRDWRHSGWTNQTDYPVILSNFHMLKKERNGSFRIYSWQAGDVEVPEKARVQFEAAAVPGWLDTDTKVEKIWMDYSIKSCQTCNLSVKDKIIKGITRSRVNDIEFTLLTPLEFSGAELMKIKIRSFQADPNGMAKINLPTLTVSEDHVTLPAGQLFVPDNASPEFEFLVQLYMADGTKFESDQWEKSRNLEVVLGSKQIKEMITEFNQ